MENMFVLHLLMLTAFCARAEDIIGTTTVDNTLKEGTFGSPIVEAVVNRIRTRCIFSDDRLFLKRAAYVTSRDGTSSDTYRPGFDGGIWQINKTMFEATKNCSNPLITRACDVISSNLTIDWSSTATWSDLRKPLYSGLAAALYTLLTLNGTSMPGNTSGQAELWGRMYGRDSADFVNAADNATNIKCQDKLDLVFILDSSGSVSAADFGLVKSFAASVVEVMDVTNNVRIADIVYGSSTRIVFDFDDHMTKDAVKAAFLNTPKDDGGTNTYQALDAAARILYNYGVSGARNDSKKVAVLVTDGRSANTAATVASAKALKDLGTTVFAVGVGNYDLTEITAVASDPKCSHVFTLTSFDHILSILTEIQNSACDANFHLTKDAPLQGQMRGSQTVRVSTEAKAPSITKTIEAEVTCAILDIYVSASDTNPGPAVYDERYQAMPDAPAVLFYVAALPEGSLVFVTVVGTPLPESAAVLLSCQGKNGSWTLAVTEKRNITVLCDDGGGAQRACTVDDNINCQDLTHTCQEKNVTRPCTRSDVIRARLCGPETSLPVDNPCTSQQTVKYAYPYDPTKYIQCKAGSTGYNVLTCKDDVIFNVDTRECGFTVPDSTTSSSSGVGRVMADFPKFIKWMFVLLHVMIFTMG